VIAICIGLWPSWAGAAPFLDGGWIWRSPLPDGAPNGVVFADPDHGWTISDIGTSLMATTDGGQTWMPQDMSSAFSYGPLGIAFPDASHGCIVGPYGRVAVTGDGGANWLGRRAPTDSFLWEVAFADAYHGWAVGDVDWRANARHSTIVATADGGDTWTLQDSGTAGGLRGVSAPDALHCWAVGYNGTITATNDGGQHWVVQDSMSSKDLRAVDFVDGLHGWAVGSGGAILATADGGLTWVAQTSGSAATLIAVSAVDSLRCWAVGVDGLVLSTDDGGAHWVSHDLATSENLTGVSFAGASAGCIVGDDTILVTSNGGAQWQSRFAGLPYSSRGNLYDLDFVDASTGWAVGQVGLVLKTDDRGVHWRKLDNGNLWNFWAVEFRDEQHGWAAADSSVLMSADGGASWTPLITVLGMPQDLLDLAFADEARAAAVGQGGLAVISDDGGATWTRRDVGTSETLYRLATDGEGRLIAVGTNGAIFLSTDGGSIWSRQPSGTDKTLVDVCLLDSRLGWAVGHGGTILTTSDGGETWSRIDAGLTADLSSVAFTDQDHGWIGVGVSKLISTSDGGLHWTAHGSLGAQRILFTDPMHGFLIVYSSILTTSTGGLPPLDTSAPTTTLHGWDGLWHADARQLSLSAADEAGGSGIASTSFRMDAGPWQTGTMVEVPAPADHSNDGVHLLTYYSTDKAGNAENPQVRQVKVDTTAPSTTVEGASAVWRRGPVAVTLVPGDGDGSGSAKTEYQLDAGAWVAATQLTVSGDGAHTVRYRSVDLVGNVEAVQTTLVMVDSTGPSAAARTARGVRGRRIALRYRITDALSSRATHVRIVIRNRRGRVVKRLELPDTATATWRTKRWTPKARGTYRYSVFAKDEAGNKQTAAGMARVIVR
jgi:photosystem II stability/assembly factor-like uncharacterized protein